MADILKGFPFLYKSEFNDPSNALEKNPTESGWTFMGIYQTAHPTWSGWEIIRQKMQQYNNNMPLASKMLYDNEKLKELVAFFYKRNFWDVAKLDDVKSQHIANEILVFGVVAGMSTAVKKAQEVIGVTIDGKVGIQTIKALNAFDEKVFDFSFDEEEIEYFRELAKKKPQNERYLDGWINRAHLV